MKNIFKAEDRVIYVGEPDDIYFRPHFKEKGFILTVNNNRTYDVIFYEASPSYICRVEERDIELEVIE